MKQAGLPWFFACVIMLLSTGLCCRSCFSYDWNCDWPELWHRAVHHAVDFNVGCFSWPSLLIAGATVPFYAMARQMDHDINASFFCWKHHQNYHQVHPAFYQFCDKSWFAIRAGLCIAAFLPIRPDLQRAAEVYLVAMPFVWLGKSFFWLFQYDGNIRPKNSQFNWRVSYYGANPSGHTTAAVFTTVFWGLVGGWPFAVPLGILTGLTLCSLVGWNRHYVSQLFGGAAFGTICACAGYYAWKRDLNRTGLGFELEGCTDNQGCPGLRCSVSW